MSVSPSEYVKCASLFPDEHIDICKVSQKPSVEFDLGIGIALPFTPPHSWHSPHPFEGCLPESMNPHTELAKIMRC